MWFEILDMIKENIDAIESLMRMDAKYANAKRQRKYLYQKTISETLEQKLLQ